MAMMQQLDDNSQLQLQNMERFYKNSATVPEYPLLIYVPRKNLLIKLVLYWVWLFLTAFFSFGVAWMLTWLSFIFLFYKLHAFSKLWKVYRYSNIFLWLPGIAIVHFAMLDSTRSFLIELLKYIFYK